MRKTLIIVGVAFLWLGCRPVSPKLVQTVTATPTLEPPPTSTATPVPTPTSTLTPTPSPTPTATATPRPTPTSTPRPTVTPPSILASLRPYSLLRKEDLVKAEHVSVDAQNLRITFSNLPAGTPVYMPFDGYVNSNFWDGLRIYNKQRTIMLIVYGYFESPISDPQALVRRGTKIGVLIDMALGPGELPVGTIIVEVFSPPDFSILKKLFPDHIQ